MGRKKVLNWQYGICYLCGREAATTPERKLTKDHIPPECFAPEPLASFTATSTSRFHYAWACQACNKYYGDLEKAFKNIMLMGKAEVDIQAADDAWSKVVSENEKSKAKYGIPSKTVRELMENLVSVRSRTSGGIHLLDTGVALMVSRKAEELKVAIKIARGLHVVHTGEIVPVDYEMGVAFNEQIMYFNQVAPTYSRSDTNFFEYFGYPVHDDPKTAVWYMRFYRGQLAMVWFRRKK